MQYPQLNTIDGPLINLSHSSGLGLIIEMKTGAYYSNQTAGNACLYPFIEGCYLPLYTELFQQEKLLDDIFTGDKYSGACFDGIDDDDANQIDLILSQSLFSSFLKVDRSKLTLSHEAWIFVSIGAHPEKYPLLPSEWLESMSSPIFGFESKHGVITWCNSD